jgi:hypothetical protein
MDGAQPNKRVDVYHPPKLDKRKKLWVIQIDRANGTTEYEEFENEGSAKLGYKRLTVQAMQAAGATKPGMPVPTQQKQVTAKRVNKNPKTKGISVVKKSNNVSLEEAQRAQEIHAAERRIRAFNLRFNPQRNSLRDIAQILTEDGYPCSHKQVKDDIDYILQLEYTIDPKRLDEAKREELERIEQLLKRWEPLARDERLNVVGVQGDHVVHLEHWNAGYKAAQIVLKLLERKHRILGIDAPQKIDIEDKTPHLSLLDWNKRKAEVATQRN